MKGFVTRALFSFVFFYFFILFLGMLLGTMFVFFLLFSFYCVCVFFFLLQNLEIRKRKKNGAKKYIVNEGFSSAVKLRGLNVVVIVFCFFQRLKTVEIVRFIIW